MSGHYQMGYIEGHPLYCNVICGINRLGYARKYNVRILQTSTSEVYGDPLVSIQIGRASCRERV